MGSGKTESEEREKDAMKKVNKNKIHLEACHLDGSIYQTLLFIESKSSIIAGTLLKFNVDHLCYFGMRLRVGIRQFASKTIFVTKQSPSQAGFAISIQQIVDFLCFAPSPALPAFFRFFTIKFNTI